MTSAPVELRRAIKRFFTSRSIYLGEDSLSYLAGQLINLDRTQCQGTMARVVQLVEQNGDGSELLDLAQLKEVLNQVNRARKNESEIPFDLPTTVAWRRSITDDQRRTSQKLVDLPNQSAWDKLSFDVYRQRFELIQALINPEVNGIFDPIDSMLIRRGSKIRILAHLSRTNDGGFIAEDLTGAVRLSLDNAAYKDGLYFEGGTFVFEGTCSSEGDLLEVEQVKMPVLKRLDLTEVVAGEQITKRPKERNSDDRIVLMSDVHMDNDKVLKALFNILKGFSTSPPNIFLLCGHFLSIQRANGYIDQAVTAFRHFANILVEFSHNYSNTQFIFIPCVDDISPMQVLPRPTLLPAIQNCFKNFKNVHFAHNPCKLIFKDHHLVIYRDDMVEKLCRSAIQMPKSVESNDIPKLFCDTIWSQRHFSPLPLFNNPIQPYFDALFQLLPAPDLLVIADRFKAFHEPETEMRRLTLNPGPFSVGDHFEYAIFYPALQRIEQSVYQEEYS